jgi:tetratricopeptide (TPR) repeat protein
LEEAKMMRKLTVLCALAVLFSITIWPNGVPVTDCDRLAAAPADPQRKVSGILPNQIDANRAIPACMAAVREYPNQARFSFQLGRAYYKAQNVQAAVTQFRKAAERGYAAAQYNLGIMCEYGQGVSQDYGEALNWYREAARQGDEMAKNKLAQLASIDPDAKRDLNVVAA